MRKCSTALGKFALVLAVLSVPWALQGCSSTAKSSAASVAATKSAWSTDQFVAADSDAGVRLNAARILTTPDGTANQVMQIASSCVLLHEGPSATTAVIGILHDGDAVRVTAATRYFRKSATGAMSEFSEGETAPSWVQVKSGDVVGWVPARSLFDPMVMATSSGAISQERAAATAGQSGKGFSEKVKRKATAMKGAAGTPELKGANYPAADAIILACETPLAYTATPGATFSPIARSAAIVDVGQPLSAVDPELATRAAAACVAAAAPPSADAGGSAVGGLLAGLGGDSDDAKMATTVANLIVELTKKSPLTPAEERVLGRECLALCIGETTVLPATSPIGAYVRSMGARIAANSTSPYPSIGFAFVVLDDDATINAMAVPGGPIVITTGMLKFLESENELATILGHEIAHVEERHGLASATDAGAEVLPRLLGIAEMASSNELNGFLAGALANLPEALREKAAGLVREQLLSALEDAYESATLAMMDNIQKGPSQAFETGADLRGMSLARAAGWDPVALQAVLQRLEAATGGYGGSSYSVSRLADATEVVGYLPKTTSEISMSAERWTKLDEYLSR